MSDRILGAACVVASAGMVWAAQGYAAEISYEPVGPRAFPLLLAALMGVGGLWLVFKPTLRGVAAFRDVPWKATLLCAAAVAAYALLFELLGFTLATALMAVPVGLAFGGSLAQALAGGAGLGLVLFLLFDKVLDVVLPSGVLSFLLGGR
ncbi:tripartite tricarboxylate transporter TctB family protein [Azohydromonas aeria]|uniref:tripartite tricarboxylate transporter TctB family protein n=1 Tax=Azohydromonas aeria TaxID=2590212 RepID=UPI0012FA322C|nr:tripartite tricarboxylate transporter TctB family protein [Azohydromonas aeria]